MTEMTLSELQTSVEMFVRGRGWERYHRVEDLAMAISIEAAELQELLLWQEVDDSNIDPRLSERMGEEISDVIIFCISLANRLGLDLSQAIIEKMNMNAIKYPQCDSAID